MELDCDLSTINSEELLRKMFQQSEDVNRKQEIRSHLYKLRETRLLDLYTTSDDPFIMSQNSAFGKDPLLPSHGESLPDQSFQSLKAKEVRDSSGGLPDMKFHAMALNQPNTTGWDVRSSSEVAPDGSAYRSETIATTDGTEKINGGVSEFQGRNEQCSSASHQGDDKNFVKKAADSSNTHLQEKVVVGDENNGRTEMKMSSTTTSSSSQVISSSSTGDNVEPFSDRYLTDSNNRKYEHTQHQHQQNQLQQQQQQRLQEEKYRHEQQQQQLRRQHEEQRHVSTQQHQQSQQFTEEFNKNRQESSRNVETEKHYEENKRYVDMDKATPEYQRHVQHLMTQPGEIISNTVEYPKPNVKMITTVKRLPDGTIVKNKRYETEETSPGSEKVHHRSTATTATNASTNQQSTQRRIEEENLQQRLRNSRDKNTTQFERQVTSQQQHPQQHVVPKNQNETEEVTNSSSFSSVKKSSRRFSTETTSSTIEELDEHSSQHGGSKPQDFSTHGFPSVKPNKLTQEYASDRPRTEQPSDNFSTQGFPSVKPHKPTQEYPSERPSPVRSTVVEHVTERQVMGTQTPTSSSPNVRTIKTADGEVVVVSKETQRSVKQKTNSERVTQTEFVTDSSGPQHPTQKVLHSSTQHERSEDFTTHGFPSVKDKSPVYNDNPMHGTPTREHPHHSHPTQDFSTHGFPSVKDHKPTQQYASERPSPVQSTAVEHITERYVTGNQSPAPSSPNVRTIQTADGEVVVVSKESQRSVKQKTNSERVFESEVVTDGSGPQYHSPRLVHSSTEHHKSEEFTTHGFPSVKDKTPAHDEPRYIEPAREHPHHSHPQEEFSTHGFPSVRSTAPVLDDMPRHSSTQVHENISVSSETRRTASHSANAERVIEVSTNVDHPHYERITQHRQTEDFSTRGFPSVKNDSGTKDISPQHYTTVRERPISPRRPHAPEDFSTHGFPSARSPTRSKPDRGFPSTKSPTRTRPDGSKPTPRKQSPQRKVVAPTSSTPKKPTSTSTSTAGRITKEHEADASHRRFAASLRSSSPVDHSRRDSQTDHPHHQRLTPRSSVSSSTTTRTYHRRDGREGSHDSAAPSETSRISSATVTRHSPAKSVGKTVVNSKQSTVKTRNVNASNETIDLTPQRILKSPSPGKIVTTTKTTSTKTIEPGSKTPTKVTKTTTTTKKPNITTTTTITTKSSINDVPKSDNLQLTKPTGEKQSPPINHNEPQSLTITKTKYSSNDASFPRNEAIAVVEPICVKKHFYQLGPSDDLTTTTTTTQPTNETITTEKTTTIETRIQPKNAKSPTYSPTAPTTSSHITHRTSEHHVIKKDSPEREYEPIEHDETEVINKPLPKPSYDVERNHPKSKPKYPKENVNITENERRTVMREQTFEKEEREYDSDEPSITSDFEPYRRSESPKPAKLKQPEIPYDDNTRVKELFNVTKTVNTNKKSTNTTDEFIRNERNQRSKQTVDIDESLDGAFISKDKIPKPTTETPTSPTFKKKGLSRRETFEERCRQILGMENEGDTQGNYNKKTDENDTSEDIRFVVKIEDCVDDNDDDKPFTINNRTDTFQNDKILNEKMKIETKQSTVSANQRSTPKYGSPEPKTQPKGNKPPMRDSPERTEVPQRSKYSPEPDSNRVSPERKSPVRQQSPSYKTRPTDVNNDYEVPKRKSPSPMRQTKSSSPVHETASPIPERQNKVSTPTRQSKSPTPTRQIGRPRQPSPSQSPTRSVDRSIQPSKSPSPTRSVDRPRQPSPSQSPTRSVDRPSQPSKSQSPTRSVDRPTLIRQGKAPSPTRQVERPRGPNKSPSPTRQVQHPTPSRKSSSPNRNYINESTTVEVVTTTNRRTKPESTNSGTKSKLKTQVFEQTTESEIDSESPLESDVESVRENIITEKSIHTNRTHKTNEPDKWKPTTKTSGRTAKETVNKTSFITSRKPSLPKSSEPSKTPIKKSPNSIQTKSIDDTQTKSSRFSSTNTTLKTTTKHIPSPKQESPIATRTPKQQTKTVEQNKTANKKNIDSTVSTIKNRLRTSSRNTTTKTQVDGPDRSRSTSPDSSPTRSTQRRRSSNIAVHTEIIIEHAGPKSPEREPVSKKPQSSTKKISKDSPDVVSTRKFPVTERKESAPVSRVTRRDDDIKMSRSTSENIMRVNGHSKPANKKPIEPSSLSPKTDRRPNKCFATKTINLSTNDKLINSKEVENVIIDIQHAKSSREPSPDKIVPTPVPANLETGKPRYPDVVQEPEDEPRRKPVVKNIPILEEGTNSFVGCHISEVNMEKMTNSTVDNIDYHDEILTTPTIEAPKSLDYPSIDKPDDECLLSVHEKVSKFAHTAEEVKKPKASSPFNPVYEKSPLVPDDDECLLTVDQKVNKFLKTAESITKTPIKIPRDVERPNLEELDEELRNDECILSVSEKVNKFITTAEKLAPNTPQKSPELVARMERHLSRQSEPGDLDDEEPKSLTIPFSENHTVELEIKRQKDILSRPSVWDKNGPRQPLEREPENDREELVPHTKTHTTDIELRRQKDILSRPSVFEGKKSPVKTQPTVPTKKSTILDKLQKFETATVEHSTTQHEEQNLPINKEPKKTIENNKPHLTTSTSVSKARSRFESEKLTKDTRTPKDKPHKPILNGKGPGKTSPRNKSYDEPSSEDETESDKEFIETEKSVSRKSSTKSTNIENEKIIQTHSKTSKTPKEISHSPTRHSSSSSPNKHPSTSTTISSTTTRVIERTSKPHPTTTTTTKSTPESKKPSITDQTQEIILNESIIESTTKTSPQPSKPRVITDSVAARRNIFEKSPVPTSPKPDNRRPSYMDHTRSSLEHIRRDSLEVNKTHYSRKPSTDDESQYPVRPNSAVKFDIPQKTIKHDSISEDINIEEIFDLEVLEEMLETVTSYELRRRIRAQIRLVKKNAFNSTSQTDSKMTTSSSSVTSHKSSVHHTSSKLHQSHHTERDTITDDRYAPKPSPSNRSHPSKTQPIDKHTPHNREHSPMAKTVSSSLKEARRVSDSEKHYSSRMEQVDSTHEVRHSPERSQSPNDYSTISKPPIKPRDRSLSPELKSKSPDVQRTPIPKPRERSPSSQHKNNAVCAERRVETVTKTTSRSNYSPDRKTSRPKTDDKTPIWADRKNILKSPSSQSPTPARKVPTPNTSRTSATKMTKTVVRQRQSNEEDSITSSYGIGPTDENGLPLFGIRALKKKNSKPMEVEPCEDNEEVTGYVIEEQWYSDGTKVPKHERQEFIYSTNEKELESMKKQVESRKSSKDDVNITRKYQKIDKDYVKKEPEAILSGSTDEFSTSNKYVRRGSVKEMSEKFIRKESTQSMNEKTSSKTSGYPKAGLIYRTNSRKESMGGNDDLDDLGTSSSTTTTTTMTKNVTSRQQPQHKTKYDNEYDYDNESAHAHHHEDYEKEHQQKEHHHHSMARSFHESESECESTSAKREFVSKKSSASSARSSSTRSFLNTTGESRIVTDVDDVLERMRNADNVVEDDDTAQDREARALLNKFIGGSVIMRGVETGNLTNSPKAKQESKTVTSTTYDDNGDKVTTKRVTKTIKSSGSSSTPVTYTTCDIEEIWDEEILKELLERATTYEERRKIRTRLRELMAEREEKTSSKAAIKTAEKTEQEIDESSASEYEEIIEEVTDYSDTEEDFKSADSIKKSPSLKSNDSSKNIAKIEKDCIDAEESKKSDKSENCDAKVKSKSPAEQKSEKAETCTKGKEKSSAGESLLPFLQNLLHKSPTPTTTKQQQATNKETASPKGKSNTTKDNTKAQTSLSSKQTHKVNTNKTSGGGAAAAPAPVSGSGSVSSSSKSRTESSKKIHSENSSNRCVTSVSNSKKISVDSSIESKQTTTATTNTDMTNKIASTPSSGNDQKSPRLKVPQREDSGIESGEDLRLIAAGLRDQLQMKNGDSNLIDEVTTALCKLESSLKEGNEIPVVGQKRKALLALVARLQAGLASPEQLDDENLLKQLNDVAEHDEHNINEPSSPENDSYRTSRHRFAKRRNRNTRHTVGVSREELADARRYMEDKLIMESISNSVTPDSSLTPPHAFPIAKNSSSGAILYSRPQEQQQQQLQMMESHHLSNQFVSNGVKNSGEFLGVEQDSVTLRNGNGAKTANSYRRPVSGEYGSVSFEQPQKGFVSDDTTNISQDSSAANGYRFNGNKKTLMKRANTIDISKITKYNPEFDTDSDLEDHGPHIGLKRAVQVSVKHKVRHVVPPFEPKTENDHKFLAFINKQSPKPGLGWNSTRSVSNWTNKFGNIKNSFETGVVAMATTGKPPQAPGHQSSISQRKQNASFPDYGHGGNRNPHWQKQQQQQLEQQQQIEAAERHRRRMERDRFERERIEQDRLERQRFERERVERDRLERERLERERELHEREYFERERERVHKERLAAAAAAAQQKQQQQELLLQQHQQQQQQLRQRKQREQAEPVNQFIHAPQSVFKPIENGNPPPHSVYKPIPQIPPYSAPASTWQQTSNMKQKLNKRSTSITSPHYLKSGNTPSPSSTATSPIGLPWLSKPTVNSDFRNKANRFEEASLNDEREAALAAANTHGLYRHNSLRSARVTQQPVDDYRKRPSLPNATDPYQAMQNQYSVPVYDLPPPVNISFRYADNNTRPTTYKSVPCLPSEVETPYRTRTDSLTNPQAMPLVLTSSNPTYGSHSENLQNKYTQGSNRQFEYVRPNVDSTPTSPSVATFAQTDYTDDDLDLDSDSNLQEYRAESKVMRKPQIQTAVTIGRRMAHMSDDEIYGKNSRPAKHLLTTMRSLGDEKRRTTNDLPPLKKKPVTPVASPTPPVCLSPDGRQYQAPIVEPLFPEVTTYAPNREPVYVNDRSSKAATTHQSSAYKKQKMQQQQEESMSYNQRSVNQQSSYKATEHTTAASKPAQAPLISETQTSYTVTYPVDEPSDIEEQYKPKPPPRSLQLQRQRNISENSTNSSLSHSYSSNLPSPNTSWTQNPVHTENQQSSVTVIENKSESIATKSSKSDATPTKTQTTTSASYQETTKENQQHVPQERTQKMSARSQTVSSTESDQKRVYQNQQQQQSSMRRQKTVDGSVTTTQHRMLSQQSSVTEPNQELMERLHQQKQLINKQMIEMRRKSLENKSDQQETQQKTSQYESEKTEVVKKEVYKSSAPPDTPDIVKSSLPKDDTMPILKKFGPPQRHCYVPSAYQSPAQTKKSSTSTTTTKVVKQSEIVRHSTLTSKPSIVETPATPQPQPQDGSTEDMIPRNIVFNNINAFTSLSRRQHQEERTVQENKSVNRLSKSDSWNQICQIQQNLKPSIPSPKFNTSGSELRRTKSGHSLAVPKMYEAGMNKEEINEKQKTVAAYFSGKKSPNSSETTNEVVVSKKSSINRTKTVEKISANRKSLTSSGSAPAIGGIIGLARSATMPSIGNINLLDESNVEDAFEQLMSAQQSQSHGTSTTEKTETKEKDGAIVTTTTKVTRTVGGGTTSKTVSPFNKFKQLDRQNSQPSQKSSSTPTTPGCSSTPNTPGTSGKIFQFTDPALNARAATVKDQLLQWCQSKTVEYENVQINNFSSSWSDGLAFCALIHHFLPDAFDYSTLTSKTRRHNFELAFTVADEKAGIAPLLDVEDMVVMKRPDWKCVFVYVQSIYRRFRNCQ